MTEGPSPELRQAVQSQFLLGTFTCHGPDHWARVEEFGMRLAPLTGADLVVVRYFALFHDSRRQSDGTDPDHGARGAELARELRGRLFEMDDPRFELLVEACRTHTAGFHHSDPTIGTCWDSDRLDLLRVGLVPDPDYLSTQAARSKEIRDWAMARTRRDVGGWLR